MESPKNILLVLGEWIEQRRIHRNSTREHVRCSKPNRWLPSPGSIVFTLSMIGLLLWAQTAGALPLPGYLNAPDAPSTGTIAYQGRLADAAGNPLTSTVNMEFRLYSAATSGTPLWSELWTGPNAVQVSDGLFNVMLGSLTPIPQNIMTGNSSLWLGITAGTDDEMMPRVQLGSVPFAVQALTVPDRSVTTAKMRPDTGQVGLQSNASVTMPAQPWTRVDIPQLATTLSLAQGTRLLVWFTATGYGVNVPHSIDIILVVDGIDHYISSTAIGPDNVTFNIAGARMLDLSAGSHQIKLQVQSGLANEVLAFSGGRVSMMYLAVSP